MKPTDIQIGDLLTFEECLNDEAYPVIQVTGILQDSFFASIDEAKADDELDYKGVVGIPLTAGILEKNGFNKTPCGMGNHVFALSDDYFACAVKEVTDSIWRVEYTNCEAHFPLCRSLIGHVHELQHCLKLFGVEKEIVV